jgi:hypothetical protein
MSIIGKITLRVFGGGVIIFAVMLLLSYSGLVISAGRFLPRYAAIALLWVGICIFWTLKSERKTTGRGRGHRW